MRSSPYPLQLLPEVPQLMHACTHMRVRALSSACDAGTHTKAYLAQHRFPAEAQV